MTEFQQLIEKAINNNLTRDLANHFEVAESTVYRWLNGVATPLPRMQKQVMDYIYDRLK